MDIAVDNLSDDSQVAFGEFETTKITKGEIYEINLTTGKLTLLDGFDVNKYDVPVPSQSSSTTKDAPNRAMLILGVVMLICALTLIAVIRRRRHR
jgi:hypothetical protein